MYSCIFCLFEHPFMDLWQQILKEKVSDQKRVLKNKPNIDPKELKELI